MKPKELLRLVWINITQNKFKVIMTSIGIIVGATTIVMVIAIGKGGQADVADQFKNLNAGAVDISYDGGTDFGGGGSSDDSDSDMAMMAPGGGGGFGGGFGGAPSGDMGGGSSSGGEAPGGSPGGEMPSGDGGGMPDMGSFFGGQSDMEDRMNQENITLSEDDVDDIETFASGISAATISYTTKSSVDGGDLDEADTYTIAGVKSNYETISNLSLAAGSFITDLKIGYWLGSTPKKQETFKFLGTLVSAATVAGVIMILNDTYGFTSGQLAAPQANAMAAVIEPLMSGAGAPWLLYGIGAAIAILLTLFNVSALAFALGMFIPLELNLPLLVGGLINWYVTTRSNKEQTNKERGEKGTLIASGFIAGGALMGVVSAALRFGGVSFDYSAWWANPASEWLSLLMYVLLIIYMIKASMRIKK